VTSTPPPKVDLTAKSVRRESRSHADSPGDLHPASPEKREKVGVSQVKACSSGFPYGKCYKELGGSPAVGLSHYVAPTYVGCDQGLLGASAHPQEADERNCGKLGQNADQQAPTKTAKTKKSEPELPPLRRDTQPRVSHTVFLSNNLLERQDSNRIPQVTT